MSMSVHIVPLEIGGKLEIGNSGKFFGKRSQDLKKEEKKKRKKVQN